MEENTKRCEWCGQDCRALSPVENRDASLSGLFVWICDGCRDAMQGEYRWEALCSPIGFRIYPKYSATLEVHRLTQLVEAFCRHL